MKTDIAIQKNVIPGYDAYKTMFEVCDRFNRNLHDRSWPHKRGGRKVRGEFGRQNDFIMAAMLQNTLNLWLCLRQRNPADYTFRQMCELLADDLYRESINYV